MAEGQVSSYEQALGAMARTSPQIHSSRGNKGVRTTPWEDRLLEWTFLENPG